MIHYVTLGQDDKRRERPVCFDHTMAYEFQKVTGRHYLLESQKLLVQLALAGEKAGTDDAVTAAAHVDIVNFVDFMHVALRLGARKAKEAIDFDEYDVAGWIMADPDAVSQLTTLFIEATYTPPAASANGEKKREVTMTPESGGS